VDVCAVIGAWETVAERRPLRQDLSVNVPPLLRKHNRGTRLMPSCMPEKRFVRGSGGEDKRGLM